MRGMRVLAAALICGALGLSGAAAAPQSAPAKAKARSEASAGAVDLNGATEAELQEVPGIGPSLAKRIVEFRNENGPFKAVEDLLKVRGIGEKSFERLKPHVTVGKK